MSIILGVVMFMFLVMIHELGHFSAAKRFGVQVLEFGLGIPPKAKKLWKDARGTEYTLNWIPLGGFVRLKGEDPSDPETFHAKDSFIKAKIHHKLIILMGGIAVNVLFAWLVFVFAFWIGVKPLTGSFVPEHASIYDNTSLLMPTQSTLRAAGFLSGDGSAQAVQATMIVTGGLAALAGIQSGDTIVSVGPVGGESVLVDTHNFTMTLKKLIGLPVTAVVMRGGQSQTVTFQCPDDNCLLGLVYTDQRMMEVLPMQYPFGQAVVVASRELRSQTQQTFRVLGGLGYNLISGNMKKAGSTLEKFSGPVGAVKFGEMILNYGGWLQYLVFGAMISLALGLFNLLPIPALDGGRMVGVLIQRAFRLRPEKYFVIENYINTFFFVTLMILGVYIMVRDLHVFWGVGG